MAPGGGEGERDVHSHLEKKKEEKRVLLAGSGKKEQGLPSRGKEPASSREKGRKEECQPPKKVQEKISL